MRVALKMALSIIVGVFPSTILFENARSLTLAAGSTSCRPSDERKKVEDMLDAFVQAWNGDDAASLASLFAEEGEFTSPSGRTVQGRGEIRDLVAEERRDMFNDTTLSLAVEDQQPSKNGTVLVEGTYTVQAPASPLGVVEFSSQGSFQFTMQPDGCTHSILTAKTTQS